MSDSLNIGEEASGDVTAPVLSSGSAQFDLLASERQLTFDGREEPLHSAVAFHRQVDAPEAPDAYAAQAELYGYPQPELPLHPLVNGKPHPDCLRGFKAKSDAHAEDGGEKASAHPECCNLQRCASSTPGNDAERSRDLWNGTARGRKRRIGMRHTLGEAALAVAVVTLPKPLRAADKSLLKRWEQAVYRALLRFLRKHTGRPDAEFYVRANIHPCGENPQQWHPHLNFQLACWSYSPSDGTAKRFKPFVDVSELRSMLAEAQREVFGDGDDAQCFWKYEQDEAGKRHQAKYVPRVFPEWAHLKLRPAGYGLAASKKRDVLTEALDSLHMKALPEWVTVSTRDGLPPAPITGRGNTEAEAVEDHRCQLAAHRRVCPHCASSYPEDRRIMRSVVATGPPEHPPPRLAPGPEPDSVPAWSRFLSLPA